jgi:Mrp family chromosome partitioning ATPase
MIDPPTRTVTDARPEDYFRPIWRFKFRILIVVALVTFGVYKYYDAKPRVYAAASVIYVGPSSFNPIVSGGTGSQTDRSLANMARLITSPQVARLVVKDLKLNVPPGALLGGVVAAPDKASDFISIQVVGGDPQFVAALANSFGRSFLRSQAEGQIATARSALQNAQDQLARVATKDSALQAALAARVNELRGLIDSPPPVGEVSVTASPPSAALSPRPKRNAIFGGVLALVLAAIAAFFFDRGDRRVREADDIEALYRAPLLATVPKIRRPAPLTDHGAEVPGTLKESFRTLRVNIDLASVDEPMNSLLVTSAVAQEGKSTVVRNLAIAFRDAGRRVVVVEADLRRPTLGRLFGLEGSSGLAEVLTGNVSLTDAVQQVRLDPGPVTGEPSATGHGSSTWSARDDLPDLKVLTAGTTMVDPTSLISAERFEALMARLFTVADIILVDSPPVLPVGDTLPLLGIVDGTLLVARPGVTTTEAGQRLRRTLDRVNARVIGTVLTGAQDSMAYGFYGNDRQSVAAADLVE